MFSLSYNRYIFVYVSILFILGSPFLVNYWFLRNAFEVQSFDKAVDYQIKKNAIFGSGLNGNSFKYKMSLARKINPDIAIIGASRVMQYRQEAFTAKMANLGGTFQDLHEGGRFIRELLKTAKPQVIVLGMDYWWLNKDFALPKGQFDFYADETDLPVFKHYKPFLWLYEGKLSFKEFVYILKGGELYNDTTSYPNIGMAAIKNSAGSRPDGSHFYLSWVSNFEGKSYFHEELGEIKDGKNARVNYGVGDFVDTERLAQFKSIIEDVQKAGVKLVLIAPPIMPIFLKEALKYNPAYLKSLERLSFNAPGVEFYDFNLLMNDDFQDCEYSDQWHLGEVAQLRVLLEILKRNPDSALKEFVNRPKVEEAISRNAGHFMVDWDADKWKVKEVDFLKLGCKK